jgi:cytidylate kinase
MSERGANVDYEDILAKVKERDRIDSTRDVAPLKAADDAVVIDSNKLDVDEVLEQVLGLCR